VSRPQVQDKSSGLELPAKSAGSLYPLDPRVWAKPGCKQCEGRGLVRFIKGSAPGLNPCSCALKRLQAARKEVGQCSECQEPARHLCGFCGGRHCHPHKERAAHGSALIKPRFGVGPWSPNCQTKNFLSKQESIELVELRTEVWDVVTVDGAWYMAMRYKLLAGADGKPARVMGGTLGDGVPYQVMDWVVKYGEASGLPRLREVRGALAYTRQGRIVNS